MRVKATLIFAFALFSTLFQGVLSAQYNYCGSFAQECQIASIAQCPQYCTPAQDLTKCPANYVVCVQTSNPNLSPSLVEQLCRIYSLMRETLYAISLLLFLLGGTIYAISHLLPASQRGTYAGYGMGMVLGGITVAIIAIAAPLIISLIQGNGIGGVISGC